ncbi:uncharacterized protein N7500_008548 [Penicillium coprophilum]|uniref:uncharacterized protein n=1 Tax=Penicillium coprophilum TaxID=36646 RepID=UPI00239BDA57|nr:uncharacterized protein N7500_008548 [Penicillium coprophilum]KAJ5158897.1 hypothetical protein N7500_008548 [Penicillium coprophilum]
MDREFLVGRNFEIGRTGRLYPIVRPSYARRVHYFLNIPGELRELIFLLDCLRGTRSGDKPCSFKHRLALYICSSFRNRPRIAPEAN